MDKTKAEQLKRHLRDLAFKQKVDLTSPMNRYTLWVENGSQGYLCFAKSPVRYPIYQLVGEFTVTGATILEVAEDGDHLHLFTCEIG